MTADLYQVLRRILVEHDSVRHGRAGEHECIMQCFDKSMVWHIRYVKPV